MTTVVIDKSFKMASDSLCCVGDMKALGKNQKIFEVSGYLIGVAGAYSQALKFIDHFTDMLEHNKVQDNTYLEIPRISTDQLVDFTALVLTPDNQCFLYETSNDCLKVDELPIAIGTGTPYAMGAMLAGADAVKAVEICSQLDIYTGGEVQVGVVPQKIKLPSREDREKMSKKQLLELTDQILEDELDADEWEIHDE